MTRYLALPLIALAACAAFAEKPKEARIPFANNGSISDWQPDGDRALWVRGIGSQWYHAELMNACYGLDSGTAIAFNANPTGEFDKFSSIIVRGQECPIQNLVESAPPPGQRPKSKD